MRIFNYIRGGRLAGLLLTLGVVVACTSPTRVKVLGFFFDGVPGTQPVRPRPAARESAAAPRLVPTVARPLPTPRPAMPIVSRHKPVVERRCRLCHETTQGFYEPIEITERLCDRCHKEMREKQGWNHGPINVGMCLPCHRAHESPYPHLLDQPVPDVCLICHKDDLAHPGKHHQVQNVNNCIACHNPHRIEKK